jgi:hypothetical protein
MIAFVIRPAHTSITTFGSAWSFALSWDARSGRTTGILDGITASDMVDLKELLGYCSKYLQHPLTLPEIFLEMITIHLNERIRIPSEEEFFVEERRTGLSRVQGYGNSGHHSAVWTWGFEDFQHSTTTANKYVTTLAYLKRRFGFAMQLTRRLLSIQEELDNCDFVGSDDIKQKITYHSIQRKERLQNKLELLENYQHHTECMQKRVDNLITVVRFNSTNPIGFLTEHNSYILYSPKSTAETRAALQKSIFKSRVQSVVRVFLSEQLLMSLSSSYPALSSQLSLV